MPPKRKRRVSLTSKGLAPGEPLKRSTLPGNSTSAWGWVGTEVVQASDITPEHCLISCGLSKRNNHPFCPNKYSPSSQVTVKPQPEETHKAPPVDGELDDDVIIISDDEGPPCGLKACKSNPNCLNYLGQEDWEDEEAATEAFMKVVALENNPSLETREPDFPVGLKNLGATCYANASLQVWFRDLAFRAGVYDCKPTDDAETRFKVSLRYFNFSLQLRTTEQQDAQEFSKLFMSHLDAEFKKQANPKVKSLVTDQFEGKQVYNTICNRCQYRSERVSDFLEIEISLKNNSKLEDRIAAVLQPETLSGDNQYLCSQCESLQDATRYTELKELPPVLHFSLLRFVYDVSTMERKKSKHAVSFPTILDMSPFLGPRSGSLPPATASTNNTYELRGVLLHKGASAYHGHYEAQVYDTENKSWFQFNDETVTKIKALGSKSKPIIVDIDDSDEKLSVSRGRKNRINARKRRRIESEDEDALPQHVSNGEKCDAVTSEPISSKDAYMLIYARKSQEFVGGQAPSEKGDIPVPTPPSPARDEVNALNVAHDQACEAYDNRANAIKAQFLERRRAVMGIYRRWNVESADADALLVSSQALSTWLTQHRGPYASAIALVEGEGKPERKRIPLHDITCIHAKVDPNKAGNIKRISRQAYLNIMKDTGWEFEPNLTIADICGECVRLSFQERLYQIEHPRLVGQFDRISEVALDCKGFWISKPWVKDWRLTKPKMHVVSEGDPAPDSGGFASDVLCEHGGLSLNTTSRRRISVEAAELLRSLYPSWNPLPTDAELCPVCDALIHISKESKRGVRKQAEDEKARLRNLYEELLSGDASALEGVPCALISANFAKAWKQWLNRPTECLRPDSLDNTPFFCEHDMLIIDPNCLSDLEASAVVIRRIDWDTLTTFYSGGPMIALEKGSQGDNTESRYRHEVPLCADCRLKWKTEWTSTEIIIRTAGTEAKEKDSKKILITYSKTGPRQSRRLREIKEHGAKRRLTISKSSTVKEIKVMVQEQLSIPTICQRLFHHGKELTDNAATVEDLQILAHDILDLQQENEVHELGTDSDEERRPREEERGFGGTVLGGSRSERQASSPPPASKLCHV
ncbi:putative cysteine proteinase [Lyophyllum shimeji]|uniref:Cysteine proteinase n=1 Tax=Lyophyllum shimeji TaxID=47721 RepID=A0A9P3UI23_LYOSH|nr:putative cysteine proteinase [Lyophyllum shimeji]